MVEIMKLDEDKRATVLSGFRRAMKALNFFGTNQNDGKQKASPSVFGLQHPFGTSAPQGIQVPANRDSQYQFGSLAEASSMIYSVFGFSKVLTGRAETPGGIGANKVINEWIGFSSTIDCKRRWYGDFFTWLINQIHIQIEGEPTDKGIAFSDTIQSIVDKMSNSNTGPVTVENL